ncbi:hypothetical protein LSH36_172g04002 [Paralvinella palmiformis]|uniref:Uncharacterized protein n=1 Tax=Paralvinella palmiformis TaxID=53620 RepID=A0AAD9JRZ8_9ANNE|nr:hypothetical protein LSH36_172g04002 [Paralvinella palmiformis]
MSNIPLPPIGYGDYPLQDSKCSSSAGSGDDSRNNKLSYGGKGKTVGIRGRYGRASRPGVRQTARKSPRKLPSIGSNSASLPPPPSSVYSSGSQTVSDYIHVIL